MFVNKASFEMCFRRFYSAIWRITPMENIHWYKSEDIGPSHEHNRWQQILFWWQHLHILWWNSPSIVVGVLLIWYQFYSKKYWKNIFQMSFLLKRMLLHQFGLIQFYVTELDDVVRTRCDWPLIRPNPVTLSLGI